MRKILHLRSSIDFLGAERVVVECCKYSTTFGYKPVIGALKYKDDKKPVITKVAQKENIDNIVFNENRKIDFSCAKTIAQFIDNENIDILHCHGYKEDLYGVLSRTSIPKIATNHLWKRQFIRGKFNAVIDSLFLRLYDKVIGVSEEIINEMEILGVNGGLHISNGVDISLFKKQERSVRIEQKFNLNKNNLTVCIIASLTPVKGHNIAIDVFKNIIKKIPETRLLIVGDGMLRTQLEEKVKTLNLQNSILFAGVCADIPEILSIVDIFLLPSLNEGLPMAMLEAMACEKAVVVTKVGENPKVIENNISGVLVPPGGKVELQEALFEVLNNKEKRRILGQNARSVVVDKYSSFNMTSQYCKLYDTLLP